MCAAVVPDDRIFVHRLKGVEVNDILQFNRVLLCGTPGDTLIGRPFLPSVTVRAAVEEHIRDSTVYIYKRRRAKGYRRFRGFRAVRPATVCALLAALHTPNASERLRSSLCCNARSASLGYTSRQEQESHVRPAKCRKCNMGIAMQELTGLRILEIRGTDGLGVPVPEWHEGASTPLTASKTLGQRVRLRRKHARKAADAAGRVDRYLENQRKYKVVSDAASYPLRMDKLPVPASTAEGGAAGESAVQGDGPVAEAALIGDGSAAEVRQHDAEGARASAEPAVADDAAGEDGAAEKRADDPEDEGVRDDSLIGDEGVGVGREGTGPKGL